MSNYVEIDGRTVYWPMCPIGGCPHRICLSLGSEYCWPHTGSGKNQSEFMADIGALDPKISDELAFLRVMIAAGFGINYHGHNIYSAGII